MKFCKSLPTEITISICVAERSLREVVPQVSIFLRHPLHWFPILIISSASRSSKRQASASGSLMWDVEMGLWAEVVHRACTLFARNWGSAKRKVRNELSHPRKRAIAMRGLGIRTSDCTCSHTINYPSRPIHGTPNS